PQPHPKGTPRARSGTAQTANQNQNQNQGQSQNLPVPQAGTQLARNRTPATETVAQAGIPLARNRTAADRNRRTGRTPQHRLGQRTSGLRPERGNHRGTLPHSRQGSPKVPPHPLLTPSEAHPRPRYAGQAHRTHRPEQGPGGTPPTHARNRGGGTTTASVEEPVAQDRSPGPGDRIAGNQTPSGHQRFTTHSHAGAEQGGPQTKSGPPPGP